MDISDITATDLQDDIIGPIIIEEYRNQITKRVKDDKYMLILAGYVKSVFQDFESISELVEDDIRLVLDEYNSSFITYELQPGIHTLNSKTFYNILQLEYPESSGEIVIEYDEISIKIKLYSRSGIIATRFDLKKSFFSTILGFTPGWDYKHYNEYTSQKIVNLSDTNKIHLKCDVIDGSVVNGMRQPKLYSFVLDKKPGYKVFSEPETIHFKKLNISVLNTITFHLEDDNNEKVNFNGEALTFTLQMIKI